MTEAIYNNRSLFSSLHLEKVVSQQTSNSLETTFEKIKKLYSYIATNANNLNESQTEKDFILPVLEVLGHAFHVQPSLSTSQGIKHPDYVFFADSQALKKAYPQINTNEFFQTAKAIGDAKKWGVNLDKKLSGGGDPFSNSNPNFQIDFYIRSSGCKWGILTNGRLWRLYHRDTSYKLDCFYEINLEKMLIDDDIAAYRYFYYFFNISALSTDISDQSFLDNVLSESIDYKVSVSGDLAGNIYSALETFINGFLTYPKNALSPSDVDTIHEKCLILLYRILFVLYAESRELLPLDNPQYRSEYSLNSLTTQIHIKMDQESSIPEFRTDYWARLKNLFTLIDKGWEEHIPQYNGGLFNPNRHEFLENNEIGNRSLAQAINRLTRTTKQELIAYQDLAIQHIGNIYEGLLEYKTKIVDDTPSVKLIRENSSRKSTGSYYTSDAIVRYMVETALDTLCVRKTYDEILKLKVLDPAMGSGHFLVGVIDFLALELATHPNSPELSVDCSETEIAYWRRRVVENCIYGVDKNPMTVELAKLTLWLHTVAKGEPLSFLDHHIRCGNSLIGARITELHTLPSPSRKRLKYETSEPSLNLEFPFTKTVSEAIGHYLVIEGIENTTIQDVQMMEQALLQAQGTLSLHKQVANLWLSVYFGNNVSRESYHAFLDALKSTNTVKPINSTEYLKADKLADDFRFFHWEIEFPEVFRDKDGNKSDSPGFDAIVGNPPYGADLDRLEIEFLKTTKSEATNTNSAALFIDSAKNHLLKPDGVIAYIVPKSLLFVQEWHDLSLVLLENTSHLVDVKESFKDVRLEQVIFIFDTLHDKKSYNSYNFLNETWTKNAPISCYAARQFKTWICDVSEEEIELGLKLKQSGRFLGDFTETKRGLSKQSYLKDSGDIPFLGGENITRFGCKGIKGYLAHDKLDVSNAKVQFLNQPKVMTQRIVAYIENPTPHIKITSTFDQEGEIFSVDTVENTVINESKCTLEFLSAILNSKLINWYAHKFIFASAMRTMNLDKYYIGKIPIPDISLSQQSPICKLAIEIMQEKQEDPNKEMTKKEDEIDELVYKLYGLIKEEIDVVNRCFS